MRYAQTSNLPLHQSKIPRPLGRGFLTTSLGRCNTHFNLDTVQIQNLNPNQKGDVMSIMVETTKRGPDVKSSVEPSIKYDGLCWYDTINQIHKFWKASGQTWVKLTDMQLVVNQSAYDVAGQRGVFGGGNNGSSSLNTIDYISISTLGNASSFGVLISSRQGLAATSNGSNGSGVFGGGNTGSLVNTIDYVTISVSGNANAFGQLTSIRQILSATSNGTTNRGVFGGGNGPTNTIDYITISTPGNASSFGQLSLARHSPASVSNLTIGVFGGGFSGSYTNTIDYITIATLGNATSFGGLSLARGYLSATSNGTAGRGVFGGGTSDGSTALNTIDYITISTPGNASSFGQLSIARFQLAATSNSNYDKGVFGGGYLTGGSSVSNTIDYVTISTAGNASAFGQLTSARYGLAACSNA